MEETVTFETVAASVDVYPEEYAYTMATCPDMPSLQPVECEV